MRETDPETVRLLDHLLDLESEAWPDARADYAAALLALSIRCEDKAGRAEIFRWASSEFAALTHHRDDRVAEARRDAIASLSTEFSGLLLRWRAGLDDDRPPNMRSMLRARILWRTGRIIESTQRRHERREDQARRLPVEQSNQARAPTLVEAQALCTRLIKDNRRVAHAWLLVGIGYSVAEAARHMGASRQQMYRYRDTLRVNLARSDRLEADENDPKPPR